MSSSHLPSGGQPEPGSDDFRTSTVQGIQIEMTRTHDAMRRFCDSVNSSGPLPLNADYLCGQLKRAMNGMIEIFVLVRLLQKQGYAVSAADLEETHVEPDTVLLPNEPVADVEGGA